MSPMIPAGKRRNLITIQQRDATPDGYGQPSNTWLLLRQAWARVRSVAGSEQFHSQQFAPEVTHEVTLTALDAAGVTPMHRIITADGNILDIQSVNFGERRLDDVTVTCKERLTQAGDLDVG